MIKWSKLLVSRGGGDRSARKTYALVAISPSVFERP